MHAFRCLCCERSLARPPVCHDCLLTLVEAPALCRDCGAPHPRKDDATNASPCPRPWLQVPGIAGYQAGYLRVGPGYGLLRRWKKTPSPLLDRLIVEPLRERVKSGLAGLEIAAVIPVPQSFTRSWSLGRSPATTLAEHAARWLRAPLRHALEPARRGKLEKRQAELSATERRERKIRFDVRESELPPFGSSLLLVDDFSTSGTTARAAARALAAAGGFNITLFSLGVRPKLG